MHFGFVSRRAARTANLRDPRSLGIADSKQPDFWFVGRFGLVIAVPRIARGFCQRLLALCLQPIPPKLFHSCSDRREVISSTRPHHRFLPALRLGFIPSAGPAQTAAAKRQARQGCKLSSATSLWITFTDLRMQFWAYSGGWI